MEKLEKLQGELKSAQTHLEYCKSKGWKHTRDAYKRKAFNLAALAVDRAYFKIEALECKRDEAVKVLRKHGLKSSTSHTTGIRGYRVFEKGYELHKTIPQFINLHSVSDSELSLISIALNKAGIEHTVFSGSRLIELKK